MTRLYNTFEFVGHINIPKDKSKFHDVRESASGWEGHRLNFAVQETKTNSVFLELYGGYSKAKPNKVFSFSKGTENEPGSKLEIPWEDRLKEETIDLVADFKKIVVDFTTDTELKEEINKLRYEIRTLEFKDELNESEKEKLTELKLQLKEKAVDRHEFIHTYDAVVFLSEKLENYVKHKFRLTGSVEYQEHRGRFFRKFNPTLIEIVPEDEVNKLRATMDIFFTKDSLDDKDFKKEKKVYINGYVLSYDNNEKKDMFFPQQLVINAQKIDFENEDHVKRFEFLKSKFNVKGKGVYHLPWLLNVFRGSDKVEFTEKDLTQAQRESIEFGLSKLEDYAPKGGMLGETTEENRLIKPLLQSFDKENNFVDGAVESNYEVDDLIYVSSVADKPTETPKVEEPVKDEKPPLVDLENLFG
ncbi:hypothetical protein AB0Y20_00845 [Heyndrickxia oleronia]|uniref:hypothetical protein n=1 Tax=Heyndrickxia oleronia TaxID=38875 RepID=UPI003F202DC4